MMMRDVPSIFSHPISSPIALISATYPSMVIRKCRSETLWHDEILFIVRDVLNSSISSPRYL